MKRRERRRLEMLGKNWEDDAWLKKPNEKREEETRCDVIGGLKRRSRRRGEEDTGQSKTKRQGEGVKEKKKGETKWRKKKGKGYKDEMRTNRMI